MAERYFRHSAGIETVKLDASEEAATYQVTVRGRVVPVVAHLSDGGRLDLNIDGRPVRAYVANEGLDCLVQVAGEAPVRLEVATSPREKRRRKGGGDSTLTANTPAQVVQVLVSPGDSVAKGDPLVTLEAMKMESRITAPRDGVVKSVGCTVGEVVERGRLLVELRPEDETR
jgi:biotin carboxyl carrier protein